MFVSLQIIFRDRLSDGTKQKLQNVLNDDSPSVIDKVNNFIKEFGIENQHGFYSANNLFFNAVMYGNVTLVDYIVKNVDVTTLNVRDDAGRNALFVCLECFRIGKGVPIAKILIGAGIDINAKQCPNATSVPHTDQELDDTLLQGDSVLGSCVKEIQKLPPAPTKPPLPWKLFGLYRLAAFLEKQGAECYISDVGTISSEINPVLESDDPQKKQTRTKYSNALQTAVLGNVSGEVEFTWQNLRLLHLGMRDPESPFQTMPADIAVLINRKIFDQE